MWYDVSRACFLVLSKRSDWFSSLQQKEPLFNVGSPINEAEGVDTEALVSAATSDTLSYLTYLMLDLYHFLILNYELYPENEEW